MEDIAPPLTATQRKQILLRDKYRCRYCGSQRDLQVDHIFPRSLGGGNQHDNLATACARCNLVKKDRVGMIPGPIQEKEFSLIFTGMPPRGKRIFFVLFMVHVLMLLAEVLAGVGFVLFEWFVLSYGLHVPSVNALFASYFAYIAMGIAVITAETWRNRIKKDALPRANLLELTVAFLT